MTLSGKCFLISAGMLGSQATCGQPYWNLVGAIDGRRLTGLTVIATASRQESRDWCFTMGAHHVIDHSRPLPQQIDALTSPPVTIIASLTHTGKHLPELVEVVAPHGKIGVIDDHEHLDVVPLKAKSISLHWEMIFTRPLFNTADLIGQHRILNEIASMVDAGILCTTMTRCLSPFSAENLREGHRLVESGAGIGKIVMCRTAPEGVARRNVFTALSEHID